MDGQAVKRLLQANKEKLFATYPLVSMALFGSYADGTATEDSDVDIMVEFNHPVGFELVDLSVDLEIILNKKVDIVTRKAIKPTMMQYVQPQLIYV